MRVSLSRLGVVAGCGAYVATITIAYGSVIYPVYGYMGFRYAPPPGLLAAAAWFAAATPSLWLPVRLRRPSQASYWLLYLLVYAPSCVFPFYSLTLEAVLVLPLVSCLFACFGLLGLIHSIPLLELPRPRLSERSFEGVLTVLALLLAACLVAVFGFRPRLPSLGEVYDVRREYAEALRGGARLAGYAVGVFSGAVNPFLLAFGLTRRKAGAFAAGVAGQLLVYSMTGFKTVFLSWVFLLGLFLLLRRGGRRFGTLLVGSATTLAAVSIGLSVIWNYHLLSAFLLQRTIATPGVLTGFYFEYFSQNPKALLGYSVLKPLVDYPYEVGPAFLIAGKYLGSPTASANANFWADGFANFGYAGMLAFTLLLGLTFLLFDSASRGRDPRVAALVLGVNTVTLANAALFTTLLTHGMAFALLLVYLSPERAQRPPGCPELPR